LVSIIDRYFKEKLFFANKQGIPDPKCDVKHTHWHSKGKEAHRKCLAKYLFLRPDDLIFLVYEMHLTRCIKNHCTVYPNKFRTNFGVYNTVLRLHTRENLQLLIHESSKVK